LATATGGQTLSQATNQQVAKLFCKGGEKFGDCATVCQHVRASKKTAMNPADNDLVCHCRKKYTIQGGEKSAGKRLAGVSAVCESAE
jgi:hypothetical protein